ncbi:hypothetical protein RO3G_13306 [Lichtheimia corymbifera JMRC:FSU:9682]|uniref:Uncharacterized protein n=1 Tax=Lichtheimia corymbifera JMRC:FSU:9682 TaxID=1263082 RepID=A0A068S7T2_9FUNG|nr:hypothetical protein RO3G_13306 [Lichtheimia corymbifera JMRC:FSU:9682]
MTFPNIKYKEVISSTLLNARDSGQTSVSLSWYLKEEADYIASTYEPHIDFGDFKSQWTRRIIEMARTLNIPMENDSPSWNVVLAAILRRSDGNNKNQQTGATPISNNYTTSSVTDETATTTTTTFHTTTTTSSESARKLSKADIDKVQQMYDDLQPERMWILSTGKPVEKEMQKFAQECEYEHPVHSLILDPTDPCWKAYFTPQELRQIQSYQSVSIPSFPDHLKTYLGTFSKMRTVQEIDDQLRASPIFSLENADLRWIQKTIMDVVNMYAYGFFPTTRESETDYVYHVWGMIRSCLSPARIKIFSGIDSKASIERRNSDRQAAGITSMRRRRRGKKPDMIFAYDALELGCTEAGLSDDGPTGTKEIKEGVLKIPKELKNMLLRLVAVAPQNRHDISTIGFIISGLQISMLVMDIPCGYVCRLSRTDRYAFPISPDFMSKQLTPILQLIYSAKELMLKTIDKLRASDTVPVSFISGADDTPIPPAFISPSSSTTTSSTSSRTRKRKSPNAK